MSWWQSLPVILLAVLAFILPGLILSLAIRIRGINSVLLAPAFTVGMGGFLATVYPFVGVPWHPATFLAGVLAVSAAAWAIRNAANRRSPEPDAEPQRRSMVVAAGLGALGAALLIGVQMGTAMISPDSISQTYDNVFHLNAVRWTMETHDASPLNLGAFTGISAYPSGWHGDGVDRRGTERGDYPGRGQRHQHRDRGRRLAARMPLPRPGRRRPQDNDDGTGLCFRGRLLDVPDDDD